MSKHAALIALIAAAKHAVATLQDAEYKDAESGTYHRPCCDQRITTGYDHDLPTHAKGCPIAALDKALGAFNA